MNARRAFPAGIPSVARQTRRRGKLSGLIDFPAETGNGCVLNHLATIEHLTANGAADPPRWSSQLLAEGTSE
jgi:hypothetical protein